MKAALTGTSPTECGPLGLLWNAGGLGFPWYGTALITGPMHSRTDFVASGQALTIGSRLRTEKGYDARHSPRTGLLTQRWTQMQWCRDPFTDPPLPLRLAGQALFLGQPSRLGGQCLMALPDLQLGLQATGLCLGGGLLALGFLLQPLQPLLLGKVRVHLTGPGLRTRTGMTRATGRTLELIHSMVPGRTWKGGPTAHEHQQDTHPTQSAHNREHPKQHRKIGQKGPVDRRPWVLAEVPVVCPHGLRGLHATRARFFLGVSRPLPEATRDFGLLDGEDVAHITA